MQTLDDENDDPLELAPTDPACDEARRRIRQRTPGIPIDPVANEPARWQFTLGQLIIANTLVAIVLALLQVIAPSLTAGVIGLAAMTLFLFVMVYQPDRPELYALAWTSIAIYALIGVIAILV